MDVLASSQNRFRRLPLGFGSVVIGTQYRPNVIRGHDRKSQCITRNYGLARCYHGDVNKHGWLVTSNMTPIIAQHDPLHRAVPFNQMWYNVFVDSSILLNDKLVAQKMLKHWNRFLNRKGECCLLWKHTLAYCVTSDWPFRCQQSITFIENILERL